MLRIGMRGFLLFGVRDVDKQIKADGRLLGYDAAKLNQYLSEHFVPHAAGDRCGQLTIRKTPLALIVPVGYNPYPLRPIECKRPSKRPGATSKGVEGARSRRN